MTKNIRVYAPDGMDRLEIAQHVMGPEFLLKAERLKYSERTFQHYLAMQQSAEQFERAYSKQMDMILQAVRAYAEKEIIQGKLKKADRSPYDSIANPEHLKAIRALVSDYHLAFIATQVGPEFVSKEDIQRLIDSGVLPPDMQHTYDPAMGGEPADAAQSIADAYNYGISMGRDPRLRGVASVLGIEPWRTKYDDPTLSSQETAARTWASGNAANTITGLGNRVGDDFSTMAVEADAELRARYQADVRQELDMNVERQQSWRKLASDLGHRTEDWSRDFKRIAATEKQAAMQQGLTSALIDREGDPDEINVAKQPSPGACPRCVALHYTSGEGSPLRIFKLSELQNNGTNVGKKQADWKATIGPLHPWCLPPGTQVQMKGYRAAIETVWVGALVLTHTRRYRAVTRLSSRHFKGSLVVLTVGNQLLKSTPEHPWLTDRGWCRADGIKAGDYLLQIHGAAATDPDPKDAPTEPGAERILSRVLVALARAGVPAGVDLNDRSQRGEPDVGGIDAQRELWHALVARLYESIEDSALMGAEYGLALASLRRFDFLAKGARPTALGAVAILGEALSLFRAARRCHDAALLADAADRYARANESGSDGSPRGPVLLCEFFDALAAAVRVDELWDRKLHFRGHDIEYHGAAVTSATREPYEGPVYNFAVDEDESYIANGFVSHNCGCELIHVPNGWAFDEDGDLMPESLMRSELLPGDLRKAHLTWGNIVPERGVVVRIGDPAKVAAADEVISRTPPEIFDRRVGITLICEDEPRVENAMSECDLAYWTGNEIRVSGKVSAEMMRHVLEHEIGHSLNVWLMYCWKGEGKVIQWHAELYQVSQGEGWVSDYARTAPIENAAELTRLYLYERKRIMLKFPRAFAMLHTAYKGIWRKGRNDRPLEDRPGEDAKQEQDRLDYRKRGGARL